MLGEQICARGRIFGDTLGYSGDDELEFRRICRAWHKSYSRKKERILDLD